jgi:hypothetical protein
MCMLCSFRIVRIQWRGFSDTGKVPTLLHSVEVKQVKTRTLHKPKGSAPRTGRGSFVLNWWCRTIRPAVRAAGKGI